MANVFYLFHVKEVSNKKKHKSFYRAKPLCGSSQRDSVQVNLFSLIKGQIRHSYLN